MKTLSKHLGGIIGIFMLSLIFKNVNAQSWNITGNSNATATSKLGTTNVIPLRFFTNNIERMHIGTDGRVGLGTATPLNIFMIKANGSNPVASWAPNTPVFTGFAEAATTELDLSTASNTADLRPVFSGKRSRGTLASPKIVANNDYIASITGAAYDGSSFLSPAAIHFYVDGTPKSGSVPARISFETGTSRGDRLERLKILNNGNFNFNNGQMFLDQSLGYVGVGTITPQFSLDVQAASAFGQFKSTGSYAGVIIDKASSSGNGYVVHRTGGVDRWTEGSIGSDNFSLHNWSTATAALAIDINNNNVGIGTSAPASRLVVTNGSTEGPTARIQNLINTNGFNDGLYVQAGNNGGTGTSYCVAFLRPDGTVIGTVSQPNATSVAYNTTSDKRLKTNIHETKFGLADIKKIEVKDYNFINSQTPQTGFIAQQLYEIFPEAVAVGGEDAKTRPWMVDYGRVTPLLVKAIQDLSESIDKKDAAIATLQQQLLDLAADVKNLKLALLKGNDNTAALAASGYLKQNVPNPSNNNTVISYYVPTSTNQAEIRISDAKGSIVKIYKVAKGEGQLNIKSGDLAKGVYSYSLYANNKAVDTKQMIMIK